MRLIDADELKTKAFGKRGGLIHTSEIDKMPTAEAVTVIRCKDCTKAEEDASIGTYWCDGREVPADHFCGYGVKKDEQQIV